METMGQLESGVLSRSPGRKSHARSVLGCSLPRCFQRTQLDPVGARAMVSDTGNLKVDSGAL